MWTWIVAIAWMYVALMMALAEATSSHGTVVGACFTLLLYGVAPLSLVMYVMGTPVRRRARQRAQAQAQAQADSGQPDAGGLPPGDAVTPEREIP
jgi:membrane protein implicated in regulation of membrane protease activity